MSLNAVFLHRRYQATGQWPTGNYVKASRTRLFEVVLVLHQAAAPQMSLLSSLEARSLDVKRKPERTDTCMTEISSGTNVADIPT